MTQKEPKRDSKVSFQGPATVIRPSAGSLLAVGGQPRASQERRVSQLVWAGAYDISVCDITGDWGLYQWSVCLFAVFYSALAAMPVVLGPILTPDLQFKCADTNSNFDQLSGALQAGAAANSSRLHECFKIIQPAGEHQDGATAPTVRPCRSFLYDDQQLGLTLTNGFNLVCDRRWLRSLVSSASLAGMLISSVTLGVFSDRFGRLRCIQLAFVVSMSANAYAIITRDYFLLCACIMLMSFAQIGVGNALCTLVMEITSPRFRFVPVFEYALGWGLGVMLVPFVHQQTLDYRWFLGTLLAGQIVLLPWLHFGVFESVRWLLSEGHFNRAQIELRRVCRFNRVRQEGAKLAQDIAIIQAQQVRKASRVFEREEAPRQLARALGTQVDETALELDMLSAAIRKSFFGVEVDENELGRAESGPRASLAGKLPASKGLALATSSEPDTLPPVLSPTLSRLSFSLTQLDGEPPLAQTAQGRPVGQLEGSNASRRKQLEAILANSQERRGSFSTQALIQLALQYSRVVEQQSAGSIFLVQIFHPRLWRTTLILMLISIMYETSYYGFIQANKFVGNNVALNFVIGGLADWAGAALATLMLIACSRKFSIISTTLVGALICFALAASYHMIPDTPIAKSPTALNNSLVPGALASVEPNETLLEQQSRDILSQADPLIDNEFNLEPISSVDVLLHELSLSNASETEPPSVDEMDKKLVELRDNVNFYLIGVAKFAISVGIQLAATVAMEVYPNNLRQSGPGAIVFMGRVGSIAAPFLFNDPSDDKHLLKLTLLVLALLGLLLSFLVPFFIVDNKDKELMDQIIEIDQEAAPKWRGPSETNP